MASTKLHIGFGAKILFLVLVSSIGLALTTGVIAMKQNVESYKNSTKLYNSHFSTTSIPRRNMKWKQH